MKSQGRPGNHFVWVFFHLSTKIAGEDSALHIAKYLCVPVREALPTFASLIKLTVTVLTSFPIYLLRV